MTYITFAHNHAGIIGSDRVRPSHRNERRRTAYWSLWCLSLGFVLVIFYLITVNSIVELGYQMRQHAQLKKTLAEQNKNLEIRLSQLNSVKNLEGATKQWGLVGVEKISYIKTDDSPLVQR